MSCVGLVVAACGDDAGQTRDEPPNTVLGATPAALSNQRLARFEFSAEGEVTDYKCALDNGGPSRCTSPYEIEVGDGPHVITVTAFNGPLGDETPATYAWTIDATAPDTAITQGPPSLDNETTVEVAFTGAPEADVAGFECSLDNADFAACTSPATFSGLVSGMHNIRVRAVDAATNADATPAIRSWMLDTSTPDTAITAGPETGATSASTVEFTFDSPDETAVFECAFDSTTAFTACSSPTAYNGLASGSHTFTVRAKNPVTNAVDPTPATRAWTVDSSAPVVTIDTMPANPTNDTTPTFTFSSPASDVSGFECQIDGVATFAACTSPYAPAALADGAYVFRVRVTDSVGNTGTASYAWTQDTEAPMVVITGGPSGPTSQTTAAFTFNTSGAPATIQCKLDAAAFTACTSPATYTNLADGPHTFSVQVADAAGNTDVDLRSFSVLTQGPTVTITGGPTGPTNTATPTFTFTTTNATTIDCRVDGGTYAPCTSPYTTPTLSQGLHSVEVRVRDAALNADTDTRSFTVDTVAPTVAIQSGPTGPTNDTTPTFGFLVGGSPMFTQCRFDAAAFAGCTTPFTPAAPLAAGNHTFEVRVTDAAGNVGNDTRTFSIVTAGPTVAITSGPSGVTGDNTPEFTFTTTNSPSVVECQLDAAPFAACTSPFVATTLADGPHTFTVRVADTAGNMATDTRSFTVDTELPTVTITSGPSGPIRVTAVTFAFTTNATTIECRFDAAPYAACTSPTSATLAEGPHQFDVRVSDGAGNSASASRTFQIDTTAPTVAIGAFNNDNDNSTNPANGAFINDPTPTFTFTAAGHTLLECKVDTGAFAPCTSGFTTSELGGTPTGGAPDHVFTVRATDAAGNTAQDVRTFDVNSQAPTATLASGPSNDCPADDAASGCDPLTSTITRDQTPTFAFTLSGNWTTANCRYDSLAFADCTPTAGNTRTFAYPGAQSPLASGGHTFHVQVCNASSICSTLIVPFTVDITPPTVSITTGPNGSCPNGGAPTDPTCDPTNDATPTFGFAGAAGAATYRCRFATGAAAPTGAFAACDSATAHTLATLADHTTYTFQVRAYDAAFNQLAAADTFLVDLVAPDISFTARPSAPPVAYQAAALPAFAFGTTLEHNPGPFLCSTSTNGAAATAFAACPSTTAYKPITSEGLHTVQVRMIDLAGNETTTAVQQFRVDDTDPTVTIAPVAASFTDGAAGTLTRLARPRFNVTIANTAAGAGIVPSALNQAATTCMFTSEGGQQRTCTIVSGDFYAAGGAVVEPSGDLADPMPNGGPNQTLTVRAADVAGNIHEPSRTFTADLTPPTIAGIVLSPASPVRTTPTLAFVIADERTGVARLCAADNTDPTVACPSATSFTRSPAYSTTGSQDGAHSYTVRAVDAAGNVVTHTESFTLDTTAPVVAITSGPGPDPASPTNSQMPVFAFSITNGGSGASPIVAPTCVMTRVTGSVNVPCSISHSVLTTSPVTGSVTPTSNLTVDGLYDVTISVLDTASGGGNTGTITRRFRVDQTAPVIALAMAAPDAAPNLYEAEPPFAFTITETGAGIGATATTCSLDGATAVACTSPFDFGAVADGEHEYCVDTVDLAGNGAAKQCTTIVIDSVAPVVAFNGTAPVNGRVLNAATSSPAFSFRVTDTTAGSLTCALAPAVAATTACPSAYTTPFEDIALAYTTLPEGSYTLTITATDALGRATPLVHTFKVDTAPPTVALTGFPAEGTVRSTALPAAIDFTVADTISGGAIACTITNAAGANQPVTCSSATFASPGPTTYTFPATALREGSNAVRIVATDGGGNASTTPVRTFVYDTEAPVLGAITGPDPVLLANNPPTYTVLVTDETAGTLACKYKRGTDADVVVPCTVGAMTNQYGASTGGVTASFSLGTLTQDGTYVLTVTATDAGAHVTTATKTIAVNVEPPATPVITSAPPPNGYPLNSYTFVFASAGVLPSGVTYECAVDGGTVYAACTSPHTLANLEFGELAQFRVRAKDADNVRSAATANLAWTPVRGTLLSYSFEPGADAVTNDSAVAGFGLTFTPGAPSDVCGIDGQGIPSTAFSTAASTVPLLRSTPDQAYIVSLWIRPTSAMATGTATLLSTGTTGNYFDLQLTRSGPGVTVTVEVGDTVGGSPGGTLTAPLSLDAWNHVAFRTATSSTRLFVGGQAVGAAIPRDPFPLAGAAGPLTGAAIAGVEIDQLQLRNDAAANICTALANGAGTETACTPAADTCVDADLDDDGFDGGVDDCDDSDPTIYPGALDAWYDGLDSDCGGNNDYDQDGDGLEVESNGGTDCDDTNASVTTGCSD